VARYVKPARASIVRPPLVLRSGERVSLALMRPPLNRKAAEAVEKGHLGLGIQDLDGYKGHRDRLPELLDAQIQTLRLESDEVDSAVVRGLSCRRLIRICPKRDCRRASQPVGVRAPLPQRRHGALGL
jgi:hypothetical protein